MDKINLTEVCKFDKTTLKETETAVKQNLPTNERKQHTTLLKYKIRRSGPRLNVSNHLLYYIPLLGN